MDRRVLPEDVKKANVAYYDALVVPQPLRIQPVRARRLSDLVSCRMGGNAVPRGPAVELSCGTGWLGCHLLSSGYLKSLICTDLSLGMLGASRACAQLNELTIDPVCADSEHLPFGDGTLAFVFGAGFLHHLTDEAAHFCEVHRVLAPGGMYLLFREPQSFGSELINRIARILTFLPGLLARVVGRGSKVTYEHEQGKTYSFRQLKAYGEQSGLTTVCVRRHSFFHSLHWLLWTRLERFPQSARVFNRLQPLADGLDTILSPVIPRVCYYEISACFRK